MFYNGITEKIVDMSGKYRVRVDLGNLSTVFFWFNNEPSEDDVRIATERYIISVEAQNPIQTIPEQEMKLWVAENRFIEFCRSLGLPDKASSDDFETLASVLKSNGKTVEAIEMSIKALALINDVTQNGGKWCDISYHII